MKIEIFKDKFAVIKSRRIMEGAFANIKDGKEITVIIKQSAIKKEDVIKIQKGYRIIRFEAVLPFNLIGFIARISKALAEEKIPIFIISTYSTDNVLIHDRHIKRAISKLKLLGFRKWR